MFSMYRVPRQGVWLRPQETNVLENNAAIPIPRYRGSGALKAFLNRPLFLILAIVVMVLGLA